MVPLRLITAVWRLPMPAISVGVPQLRMFTNTDKKSNTPTPRQILRQRRARRCSL